MPISRRTFCFAATALASSHVLLREQLEAQTAQASDLRIQELHPAGATSRPDVAAIDRDRILAAAVRYLALAPDTLTSHRSSQGSASPNEFVSYLDVQPGLTAGSSSAPAGPANSPTTSSTVPNAAAPTSAPTFDAHREALLQFTLVVPALTAASLLTRIIDPARSTAYARAAAAHLEAWFVTPATRMEPFLSYAASTPGTAGHPEGVAETSALAEVAQSISFLARTEALTPDTLAALKAWFAAFLKWLTTSRLAGLARDRKDHVGSSWLLQCTAYARLGADDTALADLRHHFRTVTLRAEILGDGSFPHELSTLNPYRNSLFNLDLLTAACDLLSTRFESLWDVQLQDGPGIRVAVARHVPFIENRGAWPYRADTRLFNHLPGRRPALLLAARAYQRPEYASLWRSLDPDPIEPAILRSFPIRQPILWVTRPQA